MRFLVISDIHGDLAYLSKLEEEFVQADAVICAGDFAEVFKEETGVPVLEALVKKHETIFSVLGNCDPPSFLEKLESYDVSVQGLIASFEGLTFIGAGGATRFTGQTPNEISEEEILGDIALVQNGEDAPWDNLVMIIHNPPHDTKLDRVSMGLHVGSKKIREAVEEIKPLVLVSGHIHESFAIDRLGNTLLINPGSLAEGRYAILEIEKKNGVFEARAELKEIIVP
ncbi:MAG TPA: metallophosphoesterase family protein [Treponemataceae bacterium]|jgi:putative phosphoesterase|nr:metallophosphoesterase family protein [Treponemataceae bacterium]